MSRIKLVTPTPPTVIEQPMPLDQALQWVSPYEDKVHPQVRIFLTQSAYQRCMAHSLSDTVHEVGGALVGEVRYDAERAQTYVVIQETLPAAFTDSSETHLTFTRDTLIDFSNRIDALFPDKRIVGWYHTHPRLGVFLSGYDTFLHRHFFPDPTQVALVIDPYYRKAGFFCWQPDALLDPKHYIGFYELSDVDDHSIVEWENLTPVTTETRSEESEV
jgi:proteasome lid subunit RPN8/RPN11